VVTAAPVEWVQRWQQVQRTPSPPACAALQHAGLKLVWLDWQHASEVFCM